MPLDELLELTYVDGDWLEECIPIETTTYTAPELKRVYKDITTSYSTSACSFGSVEFVYFS